MKKLITIISIIALLSFVPASGAFAGAHANANATSAADANATSTADANATSTASSSNNFEQPISVEVNVAGDEAPVQKDLTTINNRGHGYRGFNNAAEINYAPMPSYFGQATRNANVRPVKSIVPFKDTFTRSEVENMLKGISVDADHTGNEIAKEDKTAEDTIQVIFSAPEGEVVQTAIITTSAKNKDTSSVDVLASALMTGLNSGADYLLITAEGAGTILKSFGWGIGLSYTNATISNDEQTGGVAAGGLGISGGEAGYKSLPWIQSLGLKKK